MDSMVYFDTGERGSIDAIRSFLASVGNVRDVGDDAMYCDWSPVLPSLDDLEDEEFRFEVRRSLLTVRKSQLWWRLNDAAFRTGDLLANIANALRIMQVSKLLVEAKLAKSWWAGGTTASLTSCWDAAAFYPVSPQQRTQAAEHGFVMLSGVAVSLDMLKRFSIVGTISRPCGDVLALAGMVARLLDSQTE
jgi:hypothetical protein